MSETGPEKQKTSEILTDSEKSAVIGALNGFRESVMRGKQAQQHEQADQQVFDMLSATLKHSQNPKMKLFLEAGAAGSMRSQRGYQQMHEQFLTGFQGSNPAPELRTKIDSFVRSAAEARQYPDGEAAIQHQSAMYMQGFIQEIKNPEIDESAKDALTAAMIYTSAQSGPNSPAEQMLQQELPALL